MAISRDKKESLVAELSEILSAAKMTVFAQFSGVSVKDLQELRREARSKNVKIKVVKNRLIKVAMQNVENLKTTENSDLKGQLLYAFSDEDEVAPAQVLDNFAKNHPEIVILGAFSGTGENLDQAKTNEMAKLPSREQLVAEVVAQLLSPVNDVTNALSGNLHALLDGIEAKATN